MFTMDDPEIRVFPTPGCYAENEVMSECYAAAPISALIMTDYSHEGYSLFLAQEAERSSAGGYVYMVVGLKPDDPREFLLLIANHEDNLLVSSVDDIIEDIVENGTDSSFGVLRLRR